MVGKLGWVYYRYYNDGDTYETLTYCYEIGNYFSIFRNNKNFPEEERNEIENILINMIITKII